MSEPTAPREHEYIFINAFRALAAYWVLAYHCILWGGAGRLILPSAKIAVDLFMMISGFLMAANAVSRQDREPISSPRTWARFWTRRFFRIAPVYYVALALVFMIGTYHVAGYFELQRLNPARWAGGSYELSLKQTAYTVENLLMHVTFLFGLHPTYSRSTRLPDWSLGLEMQFYAVFPLLFLLMLRGGFIRIGLIASIAAGVLAVLVARQVTFLEPSLLVFKLQYFIAGIFIYQALRRDVTDLQRIGLTAATIALVSWERSYGWELVCLPILALAMLASGWMETRGITPAPLARLFDSRFVRFTSDTSYAVYLFHGFFISAGGLIIASNYQMIIAWPTHVRVAALTAFVTVGSYALAHVLYRAVELPGIELGKRILRRRGAVAAAQT